MNTDLMSDLKLEYAVARDRGERGAMNQLARGISLAASGELTLAREIALYHQGWHDEMFDRPAPYAEPELNYLAGRLDARRQRASSTH
ncbi:hypothetical protein [Burkholderia gladioli]|uniref:hypothetical protein n=1 Tax=Burkholderia gladioli TaxID=28095 RepID=UPI001641D276|nr:hypothetical protein [Burkholderia gladioli]